VTVSVTAATAGIANLPHDPKSQSTPAGSGDSEIAGPQWNALCRAPTSVAFTGF